MLDTRPFLRKLNFLSFLAVAFTCGHSYLAILLNCSVSNLASPREVGMQRDCCRQVCHPKRALIGAFCAIVDAETQPPALRGHTRPVVH